MILMKTLKASALRACKLRGHDMKKFKTLQWDENTNPKNCISECKVCGMEVQCLTRPAPNGIDIGGEAVALGCKDAKRRGGM